MLNKEDIVHVIKVFRGTAEEVETRVNELYTSSKVVQKYDGGDFFDVSATVDVRNGYVVAVVVARFVKEGG